MSRKIDSNFERCSCCKNVFSMSFYDRAKYVYKVRVGKTYIYQCSYNCYRKEKVKYENSRNAD